jgi:hypothetical protein
MVFEPRPDPKGRPAWRVVFEDADVRVFLALGFSMLFALTVLLGFGIPFWWSGGRDPKETWATTKEILSVLLPAETGLLGSILGFYFGSKSSEMGRSAAASYAAPRTDTVRPESSPSP